MSACTDVQTDCAVLGDASANKLRVHVSVSDWYQCAGTECKSMPMQFQLLTAAAAVAAVAMAYFMYKRAASATYLVDFYSFRPPSRSVQESLCTASCNLLATASC